MADENVEKIIQTLKVGNEVYELSAKYASNLDANADLVWANIDGLTATSADITSTTGIMTPDQINALLNSKTGAINVYTTAASTAEVTAGNTIYLIKDDSVTGADQYNEYIFDGTKAVQIGDTSVDLSEYSKTTAVANMISGYVSTATSAEAPSLWSEVTGYVDNKTTGFATSAEYWNEAYESVTGAVTASAAMTEANAGKLAFVGAITGYVDAKVAESIAETIDIASTITDTTPTSAIPNVGALTGYVDKKVEALSGDYIEKKDIKVEGTQLVIDNI